MKKVLLIITMCICFFSVGNASATKLYQDKYIYRTLFQFWYGKMDVAQYHLCDYIGGPQVGTIRFWKSGHNIWEYSDLNKAMELLDNGFDNWRQIYYYNYNRSDDYWMNGNSVQIRFY